MSMSPSMLLNLQDEAVAVGNGSSVLVYGASVAVVQVTGITTATITWEGTVDETNWVSLVAKNVASGAEASTATADGIYAVPVTGIVLLRARISAWTSGTIIANAIATDKPTMFVNTTVAAVIGVVDTELPTAAALADNAANPTAPAVGSFGMVWDGATWDRAPGNSADGALVNLGTNNDVTVTSGTITTVSTVTAVTTVAAVTAITNALPAGDNNIGNVDVLTINAVAPAFGTGAFGATVLRITQSTDDAAVVSLAILDDWDESDRAKVNLIVGQAGIAAGTGTDGATVPRVSLATNVALPAGTNNIGDVDVLTVPQSIRGPAEPVIDSYTSAAVSVGTSATDSELVAAPGASKQIWVYGLTGTIDAADGTVSIQDGDDTAITGVMELTRRGGLAISPSGNFSMPVWKVATNKALEMDTVSCGFKGVSSYPLVRV